jgi:hypothetical protein
MIVVNRIQCLNCGDIITSQHRHDYVECSCGKVAVDGGHEYLRRTGSEYREMSLNRYSSFEDIRENFVRYNSKENAYILLKDMSDEWLDKAIEMIIDTNPSSNWAILYIQEKQYRNELYEYSGDFIEGITQ